MTHIYRLIWSNKICPCIAVSGIAKSADPKASSGTIAMVVRARCALQAVAISALMSLVSNAYALPVGGVVAAGGASISSGAGATTITQATPNVSINWQGFSIGQGEAVQFVQPTSSSIALNRVLGSDPSSIMGSLSANGKVFMVNPNGVLFGQGASVNVGGLVASTLNITDADFMASTYNFTGASKGQVLNQGTINTNADSGYVALLGANVNNEGVIAAKLGTVALAAGNAITLDVAGDGLLNVTVNQGAVQALAENGGLIQADGGQVLLTAQSAGSLLPSVVNNTGVIQARSIENHNGTIRLLGDMQSGTANVGGTLDASGPGAGQTGGSVQVTGHHVGLFEQAKIDTSGDGGGGKVLVGGDLHGASSTVQNASATYMSAGSTITADAITSGSGGEVVLWATDSTRAYGNITAHGGAQGGDGGLIETSGHWLDVAGINVNASAPNGKHGAWLLDPADVTITNSTANGTFSGAIPDIFSPTAGLNSANVDAATIKNTLEAGSDVTITTTNIGGGGSGDINVGAALTWTALGTPTTLTLNAVRDVNVGATITATKGNLVSTAGRDVNVNAAITTNTGGFTANAGNNVTVAADIKTTTGDIMLRADNDGTGPGVAGGTVVFTDPGKVTINTGTASIYYNPTSYDAPNNYAPNFTGDGTVAPHMWVFAQGVNRVYNATPTATLTFKGNPALGGVVALTAGTATFNDKQVGTAKPITFSSYALSGADSGKFTLFAPLGVPTGSGITTADITKLDTNISGTRVYDATPTAAGPDLTTISALLAGDQVTVSGSGAVATKDVGVNKNVSNLVSLHLNGADADNYNLASATLTVTPAPLTVTASGGTKICGQAQILSAFTAEGLVNGETIGSVTETSPGTAVKASVVDSPYMITPSDATGGTFTPANYTINYVDGKLFVTPAVLLFATPPVPVLIPHVTPNPVLPVVIVLADIQPQLIPVGPLFVPTETPPGSYMPSQQLRDQDRQFKTDHWPLHVD